MSLLDKGNIVTYKNSINNSDDDKNNNSNSNDGNYYINKIRVIV